MGLSAHRFASATSCPGFLLPLAGAYRLTGPTVWWPLALSLLFGLLSVVIAQRLMMDTHWGIQVTTLLAIIYFTPLHVIGNLGMEHTLHLLLARGDTNAAISEHPIAEWLLEWQRPGIVPLRPFHHFS